MSYKLIASWGSSGAGKSTVAIALATQLARRRQDVLVLGMDSRCPMLPVYLPQQTALTAQHSLGSLLETLGHYQESGLKDKLHQHPKSNHIFFAGLCSGELPSISYRASEPAAVQNLLDTLRASPFQYIIIDCDASPMYEVLTLYALQHADAILRIMTPDIRGYEYVKAQLAWLGGNPTFQAKKHIRIVNPVYPLTPLSTAETLFGGFDFYLPWSQEIADYMTAGTLFTGFKSREGNQFEKQINNLCNQLMEESDE